MTEQSGSEPPMYVDSMDVYLNHWFADYEEARAHRDEHGGYLLPFREHFFVTEAPAIRHLGLDPGDPDWAAIGFDWAQPRDREAWERLSVQRWISA